MKRILCILLFALTAFGAIEHSVSDMVLGTPPERRDGPWLGTNGDGFLAVWRDLRDSTPALFAARISDDGEVLDPTGIYVTSESEGPAHVVWNGERYFVFFPIGRTIMVMSVDREGNASEPRAVLENAADIAVATNGSHILIAYEGDWVSPVIPANPYIAVLDHDASLLGVAPLSHLRNDRLAMSIVAMKDGQFVVAWNACNVGACNLNALRLGSGGERLSDPIAIGAAETETTLYANGDALVAVSRWTSWGVSADLATVNKPQPRPAGDVLQLRETAAIARVNEKTIVVTPFDEDGHATAARIPIATLEAGSAFGRIAALRNGERLLVVWAKTQPTNRFRLLGRLVHASSLQPQTETFEVTLSAPPQFDPAIAAGATESLIAWQEPDGIYAARIDDAGRGMDGRGLRLSESTRAGQPRVVFHDGRYAIAFTEDSELVIRFVTPAGVVLPDVLRVPKYVSPRVALASGGGTLVVAWSDSRDVFITREHPSLTLDPPVLVSQESDLDAIEPAVSWNGTHFLIAWAGTYDFDRAYVRSTLIARRVTPELAFAGSPVSLQRYGVEAPAIASDGKDWLIAWQSLPDYEGPAISRMRITSDGVAQDETIVARGFAPQLVWTGNSMLLAYRPKNAALTVMPVGGDGTAETIPGTALPVSGDQLGITWRNGRWIAVYPRIGDESVGFVARVFAAIAGKRKVRAIR